MYLKTMVKEAGGNPDTVKVVDVGFDLVPALITKKVDAVKGHTLTMKYLLCVMKVMNQHTLIQQIMVYRIIMSLYL